MRAVKLEVNPFTFISILELKCTKELNQHGVIRITGIIEQENGHEYMSMASAETWVNVYAISENGERRRYFAGILTGMWMKIEGQVYVLTIEVNTGSFLLDIRPHTRSFQNPGFLYPDVIHTCLEEEKGSCTVESKNNEPIGKFLLQYQESDWQFMKRLASYAGTVLIPADHTAERNVYFGYKEQSVIEKLESNSYQMEQDYEAYEKKKAAGTSGLRLADFVSYVVQSREIYDLGATVQFEGRNFVIGKISSWLKGQELYHEYNLLTKENDNLAPIYNSGLKGISLIASVTSVEKTMVTVQIAEDENKTGCGSRLFDYATVYSTPDGTGWYCMPEIGDMVRIVMPDCIEEHAYAASSIHLGAAGGRTNPDEKSWKNRQNKEILFTPGAIILTNNNGLTLELSDQEGIKAISNKNIMLKADGDIRITSQDAGINIAAQTAVSMQQGAAKVEIKDDINISGGKIYMN